MSLPDRHRLVVLVKERRERQGSGVLGIGRKGYRVRTGRNVLPFVLALALMLLLGEGTLTAAQQPLAITLVSLTSPVRHGHAASIAIRTAPGAACAITVIYKSGPSRAKGLTPKTADPQGMVTWRWLVGTRTSPGSWPIDLTCSGGGKSGMFRTFFVVE